jgi:hypothetical protein
MAQHDYDIANQSGANFRADLNNALDAIVSNNSGSSEPSTTFAYEWWIDTSANVLKLRNSANNAWITLPLSITADNSTSGALTVNGNLSTTGTLDVNGGEVILDADADTSITADTDDQIDFKIGGTDVATLTNSHLVLKGTTPKITIGDGGAEDTALIFDGNAQDFYIGLDDSADDLVIGTGSTVGTNGLVVIENGGNIGINTLTPSFRLDVNGSLSSNGNENVMRIAGSDTNNAGGITINNVFGATASARVSTLFSIDGQNQASPLAFGNGTSEAMRIDASSNVGIGTSSPAAKLQIQTQTNGNAAFQNSTSVTGGVKINCFNDAANASSPFEIDGSSLQFNIASTLTMRIDSAGNVNKYINQYSADSITMADISSVNGVGGTNNSGGLLLMKRDTGNLRSISAAGSINASGSDYAEYMTKSDECGDIDKGDVVGVDANGKLTKIFNDSISFVIKSTHPSYVGGDTWLTENQSNPEHEDYINPKSEEYNIARASVDRIAFCGQVPVNITGTFNVGDYVYPQANGTGIEAVAKSNPTFEEYQLCVGKIWAIQEDGRPFVSVKIN